MWINSGLVSNQTQQLCKKHGNEKKRELLQRVSFSSMHWVQIQIRVARREQIDQPHPHSHQTHK